MKLSRNSFNENMQNSRNKGVDEAKERESSFNKMKKKRLYIKREYYLLNKYCPIPHTCFSI